MFRNHITVALRALLKNRAFTIINIAGLCIGITCALCIFIFVKDELSYDRYHPKSDSIFRVIQEGKGEHSASLPFPAGPTILHDYPELVETETRLFNWQASTLSIVYEKGTDRKIFNEPHFFYADSTFFKVFQFPFVEGNPEKAISGPDMVVITQSTAKRYFGDEEAVGKVISFEGKQNLTVTGVIKDVPDNSHFKIDFIASFKSLEQQFGPQLGESLPQNWYWNPVWTYVLLKHPSDREALQKQMPFLVQKYYHPSLKDQTDLTLQPVTDIYLTSSSEFEIGPMSDIRYVYIFSIIGIAILLVACINFVNLTTARSAERFKEIGVRKVMGAKRFNLILQFITESMVITVVAGTLAGLLALLLVPSLGHFTEKNLHLSTLFQPLFIIAFGLIILCVGLVSGSYPAFVMSSQDAVKVLKPGSGKFSGNALLRKVLVVFQFVVSVVLISGTIIAYQQVTYLRSAKLGFEGEQVIGVPIQRSSVVPRFESFKDALLQNSDITGVTGCHAIVGRDFQTNNYKKKGEDDMVTYPLLLVRNDFFKTMDIKLLGGHDFSKEYTSPGFKGVINRAMMEKLGWKTPDEAIGQVMDAAMEKEITITGVCENFNYTSLKQPVGPMIIVGAEGPIADFFTNFLLVRVKPQNIPQTVDFMRSTWKSFVNESAFDYFFLDDKLDQIYKTEEKFNKVVTVFSMLAIGIGAMGLFGLAAFSVQKRRKEISIRKVIGASTQSIFSLLSADFLMLIVIAGIIGIPLSWYLINKWLDGFAYRVDVGILGFASSLVIILTIAVVTISFQVYKAATGNPAESLRSE
jgi:putative ABC transport system permease protein